MNNEKEQAAPPRPLKWTCIFCKHEIETTADLVAEYYNCPMCKGFGWTTAPAAIEQARPQVPASVLRAGTCPENGCAQTLPHIHTYHETAEHLRAASITIPAAAAEPAPERTPPHTYGRDCSESCPACEARNGQPDDSSFNWGKPLPGERVGICCRKDSPCRSHARVVAVPEPAAQPIHSSKEWCQHTWLRIHRSECEICSELDTSDTAEPAAQQEKIDNAFKEGYKEGLNDAPHYAALKESFPQQAEPAPTPSLWIPVSEKLPEIYQEVLVYTSLSAFEICEWDGTWNGDLRGEIGNPETVLFWQPLPSKPSGTKEE